MTDSELKQLFNLGKEKNIKHNEWLKHILLMASGLIGILISLHSEKSKTILQHYSFVITIVGLGLGILFGSICLYSDVNGANKLFKKYKEKIINKSTEKITYVNRSYSFYIFEILTYTSLIASVTSLIVYAIISDK